MKAVLAKFKVPLTKKQKQLIDKQFSAACKRGNTDRASMLGQPHTKMPGIPVIHMKNPYLEIVVTSPELFYKIQAVVIREVRAA